MVEFEIFTVDRGGGKTPQTTSPQGRIPGGERFGQLPSGKFPTREQALRASRELRNEFADRETPVGVRAVPTAAEAAAKPRFQGREVTGPAPSGRGRQRQRERLGRQAIEKAAQGIPISRAERAAAKRLTGKDPQSISETTKLQKELRGEVLTKAELTKEKAAARKKRIAETTEKFEAQPDFISTGGVPLTILGDTKRFEVQRTDLSRGFIPDRPIAPGETMQLAPPQIDFFRDKEVFGPQQLTKFEEAQQRGGLESLILIGREGLNALTIGAEDIRGGFFNIVDVIGEGIFQRPIGKVETGLFESTRDISLTGKVLTEETIQITKDQDLLFPVVAETAAKVARGVESGLEFLFEDVPRGARAAGAFVISPEGRETLFDIGKVTAKEIKQRPKETLVAAGTIGAIGVFKLGTSLTGEFRKAPVFITSEALLFGEGIRTTSIISKTAGRKGSKILREADELLVETPNVERFLDIDLTKGKLTLTKVIGKDITSTQIDLAALGAKGVAGTSRVLTSPVTQPTVSILGGSLLGGLDIGPVIPLIFGRVKRGKAARRLSKAELRKQSFDIRRSPVFVSRPQQEVGIRVRGPELKRIGVKERVIAKGPEGIRITDIGLAPRRKGLTTIFGKTEKSLLELGTLSKKQRRAFSQAETLRVVRQSGAEIEKVIDTGKGGILLQQSLKVKQIGKPPKPSPKPVSEIKRNIVDARSLELFKELRPAKKTTKFKLPKETRAERNIRLSVLKQQQESLTGGFRPGTRGKLLERIRQREAQRRLQQEIAGEPGVLPGSFGIGGGIGAQISRVFGPKRRKGKLVLFEEEIFLRGLKPIGKGEVPAFSQLPSDIFTGATGLPGRARRLRKGRLPPREDLIFGKSPKQIIAEQSLLGFDAGTRISPILSTKLGLGLGLGLGLFQPTDIGLKQFQAPTTDQFISSDVLQIPIIDTGIETRQAQDIAQESIFETPLDLFVPEPTPRDPGRDRGRDFIDIPDPFVPDRPGPGEPPPPDPFGDEPPPPDIPRRIRIRGFGLDNNLFGITNQGFDVLIREKGQDIEFDPKKSFPRQRAKNIGADIVDNSAAASFRIEKSDQPIDSGIDDVFFALEDKFRSPATKSRLPPKQFIEKRGFRIDSPGELAGITAKGLIARRKKAMRNQFDIDFSGGFEL